KSDRPREDRPEAINAEPEQELPEDENALPREWGGIEYSRELADSDPDAQFLSGMLEAMQLKCSVLAAETDDGLKLIIESDTDGLLIGRHGETLDAIQYIVSHHANRHRKEAGPRRISIDTEGYRVRREETLRKLARRNAARVVKTGRSMAMEPMNPYERRVLHYALQNFRGVTTHSEGEEPNRRVIITPTKK
ncbi:MAG TPA: RNA-binding cell elongation regulator Jag/EloR, partial [Clostridia bacterium]|nr:RNA-binding cell elongation regulator Jag/EloR [Clostridia bacterium]